ncbi:MAG: recombinase family protein [Acidobacteria bacterium]|nr:recombinase family protein [Acidobacteriota bacterium]
MRTALYTRVSSNDQNCEMQLRELRAYAQVRGWQIVTEFEDEGWSGTRSDRPAFKALMAEAATRKFDVVLCWKLDRFGRSLIDCLAAIQQLKSAGVRFIAITQGIDTDENNPAAKFQLQVLAAAAEFERELIRERVLAGTMRYRHDYESGKIGKERTSRSGRNLAIGRPKRIFDREQVFKLRSEGLSLRQIAAALGIGLGTVQRTLGGVPKCVSGEMEKAS